jgi:hypothetical protein
VQDVSCVRGSGVGRVHGGTSRATGAGGAHALDAQMAETIAKSVVLWIMAWRSTRGTSSPRAERRGVTRSPSCTSTEHAAYVNPRGRLGGRSALSAPHAHVDVEPALVAAQRDPRRPGHAAWHERHFTPTLDDPPPVEGASPSHVEDTRGRVPAVRDRKDRIVRTLALDVREVERVHDVHDVARGNAEVARLPASERGEVGLVEHLGGAAADHVVLDRDLTHLATEGSRDRGKPVRIEGEVRGPLTLGDALQELEGRGLAVHRGLHERVAAVASEAERVHTRALREERDRACVSDEHDGALREGGRDEPAHRDLLLVHVLRRAAKVRACLVGSGEDEGEEPRERDESDRASPRGRTPREAEARPQDEERDRRRVIPKALVPRRSVRRHEQRERTRGREAREDGVPRPLSREPEAGERCEPRGGRAHPCPSRARATRSRRGSRRAPSLAPRRRGRGSSRGASAARPRRRNLP